MNSSYLFVPIVALSLSCGAAVAQRASNATEIDHAAIGPVHR